MYDVCIAGAGPAGALSAILAARQGARTLLLDAGLSRPAWTETLAPVGATLLQGTRVDVRLLAAHALVCGGTVSDWAMVRGQSSGITNPWGSAWHLRRPDFDLALKAEAERAGANVVQARLDRLELASHGFRAQVAGRAVTCGRFIDATGASARAARLIGVPRRVFDRQIALAVAARADHDASLVVAALEHGWCYRAPGADGGVDVVVITDRLALRARGEPALLADAFAALRVEANSCGRARRRAVVWQGLAGALPEGFEAVGDAAWTADPLSGQGLSLAVASALGAAGNREASARPSLRQHIRARTELYAGSRYASAAYYERRLNTCRVAEEMAYEN